MHERGLSYAAALGDAQRLGFAEADPTLDVDGTDACQKLAILARLAFGGWVDWRRIRRRGVADLDAVEVAYAQELGYVVKLLATGQIEDGKLALRVAPTFVPNAHPLAAVRGEYNAVQIVGDAVGDAYFSGRGAGGAATASSVAADILAVASGRAARTFAGTRLWEDDAHAATFAPDESPASRFYLRFSIVDRPGVIAQIAGVLGGRGISIASVIQHEVPENRPADLGVPLIIMTHQAREADVRAALSETDSLSVVRQAAVCMPVAEEQRY
jgi:homoserine dehydrogenase